MPEDTIYEPSAIDRVYTVGKKHTLTYVALYLGLGVFFALAAAIFGAWMGFAYVSWASAFLFFACGLKAVAVVLQNERETRTKIANLVSAGVALIYAEVRNKTSAPLTPAAPALPEASAKTGNETTSGAGDTFTSRKVCGLPVLLLEYMCNYIVKNSWAEARLENVQAPYVYPPTLFGKAQGNTLYNQLFHPERGVFCRAGIIGGRKPKDSGELLITNPVEMMEKIYALDKTVMQNA